MKHLGLISVILIVCAFTVSCSKGSGSSQSVADAGPVVDAEPDCLPEHAKRCIDGHQPGPTHVV